MLGGERGDIGDEEREFGEGVRKASEGDECLGSVWDEEVR